MTDYRLGNSRVYASESVAFSGDCQANFAVPSFRGMTYLCRARHHALKKAKLTGAFGIWRAKK